MSDWFDRAVEELESQLESGEISNTEFRSEMRYLRDEYDAAQEAGDVQKKGIETIEVEGNTFKRTFDHMRKGYRYHPTKGFKKVWQSPQPLLMTSLLLQYGVAPLEM
jgi:hypothetical protein